MTVADITLTVFTLFNSLRFLAYIPQIVKAIKDESGAEAISFGTWGLFLASHASAMAYAIENQGDWKMASLFLSNAAGCGAILAIAAWQRYRHRRRTRDASRAVMSRLAARTCVAVGSWGRGKSAAVGSSSQLGHFESVQGRPYTSGSGPSYCGLFMNREARRRLKWFGGTGSSFKILQTFSFPVAATVPGRKDIHHPNGVIHRDSARYVYGCGGSRCWFDYSYDRSRW